ncbi:hypothetical protein OHB41_24935 [Streptomyces sp. NBC_01571]|uniref:hypothetical protein n=1 Tax=Streptomyces sp. NBC_01571 TaxID=2975883 RepID=UPI0022582A67|nr:hypothetical protein [Streptomyces sp. NBC_01571]MCX4576363.1 hypothetical protein [Streptomyces sp. NBC_01571]
MKRHSRSARWSAEVERLREIFAEAACDVTPSPVPLAAVERAARRRRRAAAVAGSACALLMVPAAAVALRAGVGTGADATRVTGPSAGPRGSVRVVTPGERVRIASGIRIWLTEDGGHWTVPWSSAPRFRGVKDDGIGIRTPGVTLQEEGDGDHGHFVSGIYHGKGDAARVRIETTAGDVDGTALTLAGSPHWGVWYALVKHSKPRKTPKPLESPEAQQEMSWTPGMPTKRRFPGGPTKRVTVYDSAGKVIATMEFAT